MSLLVPNVCSKLEPAPRTGIVRNHAIEINTVNAPQWSDLLCQFDDATIYQTWSYGAIHWGREQLEHVVLRQDGEVVGLAQLRLVRLPFSQTGIAYVRWGPLFRLRGLPPDLGRCQAMLAALKAEYVDRRGMMLRLVPHAFDADPFSAALKSQCVSMGMTPNPQFPSYRTARLDLSSSLLDLRKSLDQKWRNCLNSAERNGLTLVQGSSLALYDRFLEVYREMMTRKRFETTVRVDEFRKLQQDLPEPSKMQVFLCEKDGRTLNAIVISAIGDTAIYLLGATAEAGLNLKGAYLLQWSAISWLKSRACRYYDLGGINPQRNPGVYHFKSGFGADEVQQIGAYDLAGSWRSAAFVKAVERFQALGRQTKVWLAECSLVLARTKPKS